MTRSVKRSVLIAILALAMVVPMVFAAVAAASGPVYPGYWSSSESQPLPGQTLRYVWGDAQMYVYKLPGNVTHKGYIHVEMTYNWADYDCYIYLYNEYGECVSQSDGYSTYSQGWWGDWYGKEVIDFYVEDIVNQDVNATGDDLVGDAYYVCVQPWADDHAFDLKGYYPRIDFVEGGPNPVDSDGNWWRGKFTFPKDGKKWIHASPYGYGFDFTPTSEGKGYINLRYPFDPKAKQPLPEYTDPTKKAAAFDQYLYNWEWSDAGAIWDETIAGPTGHWNQTHTIGGAPPLVMAPDATWTRKISNAFAVKDGGGMPPNKVLHHSANVAMVAADPDLGWMSAPKEGMSTVGFLASYLYPQNLWLDKSAFKVASGKVKMSGSLAIAPAWSDPAGDTTIGWAPDASVVTIQAKKSGSDSWSNIGKGMVNGAEGVWFTASNVKAKRGTWSYRGMWKGSEMESITVKTRAKNVDDGAGGFVYGPWQTVALKQVDQQLYADGSYDILVGALDKTNGVTFKSMADLVGGSLLNVTLKKGDPTLTVTFDNKLTQPVQISFVSTDIWTEYSLSKKATY